MFATRTLPPDTNGRITGMLEIDIICIRITDVRCDSCDQIRVGIKFWGETEHSKIRPRTTITKEGIQKVAGDDTSIKYAIRTSLILYQLYLKHIYKQEFVIMNSKDVVIGSSYENNCLRNMFDNTRRTLPIVNYCGEKIGDIEVKYNLLYNNEQFDKRTWIYGSKKVEKSPLSMKRVDNHMNRNKLFGSVHVSPPRNIGFQIDKQDKAASAFSRPSPIKTISSPKKIVFKHPEISKPTQAVTKQFQSKPKLHFLTSQKKKVIPISSPKKNKETMTEHATCSPKSINNVTTEVSKLNKQIFPQTICQQYTGSCDSLTSNNINDKLVLNYLLGKKMTKYEESIALEEFIKMTPSKELVDAVNELYDDAESIDCPCVPRNLYIKRDMGECAKYDLTNPIEKLYYETFLKESSVPEKEIYGLGNNILKDSYDDNITEFLNHPDVKHSLPYHKKLNPR